MTARLALAVAAVAVLAGACTTGGGDEGESEGGGPSSGGFADPAWFAERQDDYLAFATTELDPGSIINVLAHAERAEREAGFEWDAASVTPEALAEPLADITGWKDTSDFDGLYLVNLLYGYADQLPEDTVAEIERALPGGFDVVYESPSEGRIGFGQDGPFTVDGRPVDLRVDGRYDNPWAEVGFRSGRYEVPDAAGGLVLDFEAGTRAAS